MSTKHTKSRSLTKTNEVYDFARFSSSQAHDVPSANLAHVEYYAGRKPASDPSKKLSRTGSVVMTLGHVKTYVFGHPIWLPGASLSGKRVAGKQRFISALHASDCPCGTAPFEHIESDKQTIGANFKYECRVEVNY